MKQSLLRQNPEFAGDNGETVHIECCLVVGLGPSFLFFLLMMTGSSSTGKTRNHGIWLSDIATFHVSSAVRDDSTRLASAINAVNGFIGGLPSPGQYDGNFNSLVEICQCHAFLASFQKVFRPRRVALHATRRWTACHFLGGVSCADEFFFRPQ